MCITDRHGIKGRSQSGWLREQEHEAGDPAGTAWHAGSQLLQVPRGNEDGRLNAQEQNGRKMVAHKPAISTHQYKTLNS